MTKKDPAILRAERLRVVTSLPEYRDTLGKWIEQLTADALELIDQASSNEDMYTARGFHRAAKQLQEQIDSIFQAEKAAVAKLAKGK